MKKLFSLALWSILLSFIIALVFSGCTTYRNLNLSKIQEFKQDVLQTYPLSQVTCKYDYESGVTITINRLNYSEECAYTILNYLRPIVRDEVFIQELFELFEKESNGDPNWKNGRRPRIRLYLDVWGNSRYQFVTSATQERYNSGYDLDSYTWDGYTTWYGTKFVNDEPREITPEEIEEAIEKYG